MIRAAALLALVAALGLVAAACGGEDEPDASEGRATEWANDLCSAVTTWTDELQRVGDEVTNLSSLSLDRVREAGSEMEQATDAFLDEVHELGRPDTESGEEVQSTLDALVDTLEGQKQEIEQALDGVSGITGVASAVRTIASALTTMGREFESAFDRLNDVDADGELEQAFRDADACAEFMSR